MEGYSAGAARTAWMTVTDLALNTPGQTQRVCALVHSYVVQFVVVQVRMVITPGGRNDWEELEGSPWDAGILCV